MICENKTKNRVIRTANKGQKHLASQAMHLYTPLIDFVHLRNEVNYRYVSALH